MIIVQMPDGSTRQYSQASIGLDYALRGGGIPFDSATGKRLNLQSYLPNFGVVPMGTPGSGYLVDGCPLNVYFAQGWLPGQQKALDISNIQCGGNGSNSCSCCPHLTAGKPFDTEIPPTYGTRS